MTTTPTTRRSLILFSCILLLSLWSAKAGHPLDTLRQRMVDSYVAVVQTDPAVRERIEYIARNTDGTDVVIRELPDGPNDSLTALWVETFEPKDSLWHDIDYRSQQRGAWPPAFHLQRISQIARSYQSEGSPYHRSPEVSDLLHRAVNKWFGMRLVCPNWWYNEIGGPRLLAPALLILDRELSAEERAKAIRYLKQARIGMTGQNRTWLAGNVLVRGLLERNDSLVRQARDAIAAEITVAAPGKEGIQPDHSFHQHGPQQQFGNYGLAYLTGIASWGRVFQGTPYAFGSEQTAILRDFVLGGISKTIWRGMMDVSACGRQLFVNTQEGKALAFGKALLDMAVLDTAYAAQYCELYDQLIRPSEKEVCEERYTHFYNSDMSVSRHPRWMASLKISSRRSVGAEVVNGENLLCNQMGDGVLLVYKTGREYRNMAPVWDYTGLPGITTAVDSDTCAPFRNGGYREFRGNTDFAGGVVSSDSLHGVSAMIVERDGLRARKAWFFSEDYIICRGDSIAGRSYRGLRPVRTTVARELAAGPVRVTDDRGRVSLFQIGERVVLGVGRWPVLVEHAGTGYWFPDPATAREVEISWGPVTGNWRRFATMYDTTAVTENIFAVTIGHGMAPSSASYTYVVVPEVGRVGAKRLLRGGAPFRLADEGIGVQWKVGKRTEAVFFAPGAVRFGGGEEWSSSGPALVAVDGAAGVASLADPTQRGNRIVLKSDRTGNGTAFDTSGFGGRTVHAPFVRAERDVKR